ncbi:MAG: HlyD family efflux transporter periplasmic adaptor subunit [Bacteroidales bacterium]|jgi:HlyD family secretion protein|nr:HlyD family efflux transporter periplasmic adaptor subunit [Bacteroidales bacterium]MDD2205574.1 HlyD family efflux transporter periplasmic adaptor subunit [Bacteroidales bacterium]MDD3914971.1 HlyD family efflux transporter periplasmic adaptor subunit [Bacteroidales bacterium]MDD4634829.1 HlyD family efflux transporter periplasmic adaptor subunit [Bacteroidales bacterium]
MDRQIEKKKGLKVIFQKKNLIYVAIALFIAFVLWLIFRDNSSSQRIDTRAVSVSTAKAGEFNDYIRVSGQVQPISTVQISPMEGGVVEEIIKEEGSEVKKGDIIIILSNANLDLQILNSEAELAEKENILRNTMISMEQQKLSVEQERIQYQLDTRRSKRAFEQNKALYADSLISKEVYLQAKEDYEIAMDKLKLILNRQKQDSLYRSVEIEQMQESLDNMRLNMKMIRERKDNLAVKAPIDGELGLLDVVLGQSVASGMKIGQINDLSNYKIEAQIDEHYIDKITTGLEATFDRQGETYNASLRKVYPEVRDGRFKADFKLAGERPENIRSGQTYYLNLQLGQPSEAILIPRGTFYQKTGGNWIYVVDTSGDKAVKRQIKIGRQNPQYYEVLEGLSAGEKVITSSYDNYGDVDVLIFNQKVQ